ncbi:sugar ABC transporter substrate-binding protein [Paeniglutamicibacter antarcticus]|uniref:Sugar ABC transporter substrate-binding protein n=1 Tax=Arthrobacter terrae TaxID=2935737 RepID=A0A931G495_9MICC|nr:sugar ABC transporter substrate-binding protein [Arthrobacter terrae]MBG0738568.1 sugar ABC transporter substrate-binding protein [Arthrobacter terrae]
MKRTTSSVRILSMAAIAVLAAGLAACGSGGGGGNASAALTAKGPIKIWYSNNEYEVKWGKEMVASWNEAHPDQKIDAQEIPAGKSSEETIGAAITAGNAPCLVFNTAPVAVPQFQKQGGLVALDSFPDGVQYVKDRTGDLADQYKSADGKLYQLPWKSNPVVLFYNKDLFTKAGLDPENPKLGTESELLDTARTLVNSGAAQKAIWPSPAGDYFQSWFDFYPFYAANSKGTQLIEDGKATFDDSQGKQVAAMFATLYKENLASKEVYQGDSFAEGKSAMALAGPWAIASYKDKVNWGTVPIPGTQKQDKSYTFSDAKNVGLYSACKNQATAWEVLKFATSKDEDGKLLSETGQMPMRKDLPTTYADYFAANPLYKDFADQASRTVEVPNVTNSVQIWQTFRDAWNKSVIFANQSIDDAFKAAADKINQLAAQK